MIPAPSNSAKNRKVIVRAITSLHRDQEWWEWREHTVIWKRLAYMMQDGGTDLRYEQSTKRYLLVYIEVAVETIQILMGSQNISNIHEKRLYIEESLMNKTLLTIV